MDKMTALYWLCLLLIPGVSALKFLFGHEDEDRNLVRNFGFEDNVDKDDWNTKKGTMERIDEESHTGCWCAKVTDRSTKTGGPYQEIPFGPGELEMKADTMYYLSSFVKLLGNATDYNARYGIVRYFYKFFNSDKSLDKQDDIGRLTWLLADGRWRQLGGDLRTPEVAPLKMRIFHRVEPQELDYLIDTMAVSVIPSWSDDWSDFLDGEIDKNRKGQLNVGLSLPPSIPASSVEIDVFHEYHHYAFGTAVKAPWINQKDPINEKYRNFLKQKFKWAVFENDMKWPKMEKIKNQVQYISIDEALKWMHDNGITVRGHPILWEVQRRNPLWLQDLAVTNSTEFKEHILRRVGYMADHYKGKVVQWDVCNEFLNAHWYEQTHGDNDMVFKEFKLVNSIDPNVTLCISDYMIARGGGFQTSNHLELARTLKFRDAHVGCIGVLGHLRKIPLTLERLRKRMEILSYANLPIMITEFSIHDLNETKKTLAMEQSMKLYYSVPHVMGVNIWGFSDVPGLLFDDTIALTQGEDFIPNPTGQIMFDLFEKIWKTNLTFTPTTADDIASVRAFQGHYQANVYVDGSHVHTQEFDVFQYVGQTNVIIEVPPP